MDTKLKSIPGPNFADEMDKRVSANSNIHLLDPQLHTIHFPNIPRPKLGVPKNCAATAATPINTDWPPTNATVVLASKSLSSTSSSGPLVFSGFSDLSSANKRVNDLSTRRGGWKVMAITSFLKEVQTNPEDTRSLLTSWLEVNAESLVILQSETRKRQRLILFLIFLALLESLVTMNCRSITERI